MSYILDALRKSDQLRQRGAAPTLLLGQAATPGPKQPAFFYYGLLALVLLGAGIAIGWLRPWQSAPVAAPPAAVAANGPASEVRVPAPPPDSAPVPVQETRAQPAAQIAAPAMRPVPPPAPAKPRAHASDKPKVQTAPPKPVAEAPKRAADSAPPKSPPIGAAPSAPVVAMSDLPLAIQQELPPMSISVHAYSSKAGERLVGINNRLLHEGQEVAPGLKLEEITPNGMILSYRGYNFRRGVH
ncbi:MAG: general secretion pathway protein GspB [Burkholderiales bacterium]|nr:general secretion pathway protein GspB [Burkholderiales bacterium]